MDARKDFQNVWMQDAAIRPQQLFNSDGLELLDTPFCHNWPAHDTSTWLEG